MGQAAEATDVMTALLRAAAARPAAQPWITLIFKDAADEQVSPARLIGAAQAWARQLQERGLGKGARVAICLNHGLHLYASFLGVMLAGGVPSMFAPHSEKQNKQDQEQVFKKLLKGSGSQFLICDDTTFAESAFSNSILDPASLDLSAPSAPVTINAQTTDVAFVQYSSGTTGLKKGVAVTHGMLLRHIDDYARVLELTAEDRICSWLPLYHDMGLIAAFFLPLLKGASLVAMSPFDWVQRPASLMAAIARHRATLCWQPNFAYKLLARHAGDFDLSSMRQWINCSEPVLIDNHAAFIAAFETAGVRPGTLATCYAMAETVFAVTSSGKAGPAQIRVDADTLAQGRIVDSAESNARILMSSGRALPNVSIRILSAELNALPEGAVGQIAVRTPSLFSGYSGDESAAFCEDHFLTGDTGFLKDGELFVLGREKDVIIVAGRNIYPQDIEAIVDGVAGVVPGRCAAFGVANDTLGTESLVVLAESREADPDALARLTQEVVRRITVESGVAPGAVDIKPHMWLKKATSGKISRRLNRERYVGEVFAQERAGRSEKRSGNTLEIIRNVVHAIIKDAGKNAALLGDEDSFFDLGLIDSLSYAQLLLDLERALTRPIPPAVLKEPYANASVAALMKSYDAAGGIPAEQPVREDWRARRQELSPQFADSDRVRLIPVPYIMRTPAPNFTSPSANTDDAGFRVTIKNGARITRAAFAEAPGKKGILLGNSTCWGTGASADVNVVHNVLNSAMPDVTWYSLALRMTTLTQERLAAELLAPLDVDYVVWVSGRLFVHSGISTFDHSHVMPFPDQLAFERAMGWNNPNTSTTVDLHARMAEMARLLEREFALLCRVFGRTARIVFVLQPAYEDCGKQIHPHEQEMADLFAAMPGAHKETGEIQIASRHVLKHFTAWAQALAAKYGMGFASASSSPRFKGSEWLFADPGHLTDAGHVALAGVIQDALAAK